MTDELNNRPNGKTKKNEDNGNNPGAGNSTDSGENYRERLRLLMQERAFKTGNFTLASGKSSPYYFNSKVVILSAEGAFLVAKAFLEKIKPLTLDAVGGAAMGAVPLAGSLAPLCYQAGMGHINFFVDRKQAKQHGDSQRIEGPALPGGARVAVIEDVVTTGGSAMSTALHLRELGCQVVKVIPLLDRKEGAAELFAAENMELDPIFTIEDML